MCCCATTSPPPGLTDDALRTLILMVLATGASGLVQPGAPTVFGP